MTLNVLHLTWATPVVMFLILLPVPCWELEMQLVPTSITVFPGEDATIPCNFHSTPKENVNISWVLLVKTLNQTYMEKINITDTTKNLTIRNAQKEDSGVYICKVTAGNKTLISCGTYLRLKKPPVYMFFNIGESTKNRLITAEGIILLLCAIIPGTFLLYKRCQQAEAHKRIWEAYSTAAKATQNEYTPLTVELLAIQGASATI